MGEYYLFAAFVFALVLAAVSFGAIILSGAKKKRLRELNDRESGLLKLYRDIETLSGSFFSEAEELLDTLHETGDRLDGLAKSCAEPELVVASTSISASPSQITIPAQASPVSAPPPVAEVPAAEAEEPAAPARVSHRKAVLEMASRGVPQYDIARQLAITQNEVALIVEIGHKTGSISPAPSIAAPAPEKPKLQRASIIRAPIMSAPAAPEALAPEPVAYEAIAAAPVEQVQIEQVAIEPAPAVHEPVITTPVFEIIRTAEPTSEPMPEYAEPPQYTPEQYQYAAPAEPETSAAPAFTGYYAAPETPEPSATAELLEMYAAPYNSEGEYTEYTEYATEPYYDYNSGEYTAPADEAFNA
ncbi:MAG: hypothetical protein LBH17_07560 [Oscillospiraceae bacterium]|jgi:hypothetical protein|nr:hypothetical protein [Oscillospiraceae bacterium]